MSNEVGQVPEKQGRWAKFGDAVKKAAADAQAANAERARKEAEAQAASAQAAGNLVDKAVFGGQTVEVYEGGYVRVGAFLTKKSPYEKLRSIKFSHQMQDKSSGGRAMAAMATGGLSRLTSKEKRVLFLTIATDRQVHTLQATGGMGRTEDKAAMKLEALAQSVLDSSPTAPPVVVQVSAPETVVAPDPLEQLKKLGELRDAGILSEDEFSAKKADILSRM